MDITALLALLPTKYLPYLTAAVTIAAVLSAAMPAPKKTSGAYYMAYQAVNWIALNLWHARNLSAPESTGIVGGAGAVTAPLIATAVVPLAVATPEQKSVTVPHP